MIVLLVAAVFASPAETVSPKIDAAAVAAPAAAVAPTIEAMASSMAGHPAAVRCTWSADDWICATNGFPALGYVWSNDLGTVYLGPYACEALQDSRSPLFGGGLYVLAHEAAHAAGVESEAEAARWGLKFPVVLAERFYGIPFGSPRSHGVAIASQRIHGLTLPVG